MVIVRCGSGSFDGTHALTAEDRVMTEIIFVVEEAPDGGYTARALSASIYTEADSMESLREALRDAVRCHFDEGLRPKIIRLHRTHEEVIAA